MQKTIKIKLIPTKNQQKLICDRMSEYIRTTNSLTEKMLDMKQGETMSTKDFSANLPSAVKNQCIRDAKSILRKHKKGLTKSVAVLKKPVCIWNNQNFSLEEETISFPVWIGKSKKISVKAILPKEYKEVFSCYKLGTLRINKKSHQYIAQITIAVPEESPAKGTNLLGVDLGIKVPAVCVTRDNKVKFIGNGRKNKYIRRYYKVKRKTLGKSKKLSAIKKLKDKEQRIMRDIDHKISRQIVNFAKENKVFIIRLEKLANIRRTTRTSRKNNSSLHSWSFYRLAQFIEYKANFEGIKVEYVNPKYTSQICSCCGARNKAKDRTYGCNCGYTRHRDLVGAKNIITAPVVCGNSISA